MAKKKPEVEKIDWSRLEEAEDDALRRHARADFRLKELQKELQDLKKIVDTNDQQDAFRKIKKYRKSKRGIISQVAKLERSADYSPESYRIEYESLYGPLESSEGSTELRDDEQGNEDDLL